MGAMATIAEEVDSVVEVEVDSIVAIVTVVMTVAVAADSAEAVIAVVVATVIAVEAEAAGEVTATIAGTRATWTFPAVPVEVAVDGETKAVAAAACPPYMAPKKVNQEKEDEKLAALGP